MASPRVFVSSTCYDLSEIRDGLSSFIDSYGFEPVLSERGDIFYHPDLHTSESCTNEMGNCHLCILVIGGRFGGTYEVDRKQSIVNAEYRAAKACSIPVFSFVKNAVLIDHRLFEKNRLKNIVKEIDYPSIEQQEYAIDIFEFINEVRNATINNGVFGFEYGKDIQDILKKQWAGMMYDFLSRRKQKSELEVATTLINNLSIASKKTEEILEVIYKHIDKTNAEKKIKEIDAESESRQFFGEIMAYFDIKELYAESIEKIIQANMEVPWYEFLLNFTGFQYSGEIFKTINDSTISKGEQYLIHNKTHKGIWVSYYYGTPKRLADMYATFKSLKPEQRKKILTEFVKESQ